jgi:EmrB/QacA subfamily drug resistance transporter
MQADPYEEARATFARHQRLIPAIIGAGLLMHNLDTTIIANALPTMARELGEHPLALNLAISLYMLSAAIFLPVSAWVADRYGARKVFMAAMGGFALSSLLCGLAQNLPQIIAARVLQGMAGAMMLPVGRLVLLRTAPKERMIDAMAMLTVPALIGPIVGPAVGGFIISIATWQWVFFINIPVAIIGVVLTARYVPSIREAAPGRFDLTGFALIALGLGGLVFGLENLENGVLPLQAAWGLLALGAIASALYVIHARRTPNPIVDFSVMRIPTFFASLVGGLFPRILIGGTPFLMALLLQMGFGMTPLQAGSITCAGAIGALGMKATAAPLLRRFGFRRTLIVNAVLIAATSALFMVFSSATPLWVIFLVLLSSGFFRSLQFTAMNTMAFADVGPEQLSRASALSAIGQQTMQALGVAVAALVVHAVMLALGRDELGAAVVTPTFGLLAAFSLLSIPFFARLSKDAGAAMTGAPSPVAEETRG